MPRFEVPPFLNEHIPVHHRELCKPFFNGNSVNDVVKYCLPFLIDKELISHEDYTSCLTIIDIRNKIIHRTAFKIDDELIDKCFWNVEKVIRTLVPSKLFKSKTILFTKP